MKTKETILIIDDDATQLRTACVALEDTYKTIVAVSGEQAINLIKKRINEKNMPDLVLLDVNMPGMDGYETLKNIKKIDGAEFLPVIFLTSDTDDACEIKGMKQGAYDYVKKPFHKDILCARIQRTLDIFAEKRELAQKVSAAEMLAETSREESYKDSLTGLWNRKYLEETAEKYLTRHSGVCLFMLDMDNFKGINDTYGHQMGDAVLALIGSILSECSRERDIACRLGGDEFTLFLPDVTNRVIAEKIAKRIISKAKEELNKLLPENATSVSIGIALQKEQNCKFSDLYEQADAALYHIKRLGKDNYAFAEEIGKEE